MDTSLPSRISVAERLDPEVLDFQRRLAAAYRQHPDLTDVGRDDARRIAESVRAPFAEGGPAMARTTEYQVSDGDQRVRLRLLVPEISAPATGWPVLLYLHGGGWQYFSIDTHDRLMREYAQAAGIAVVGMDYSLSPEARYPTAMNQVVAVMQWLRQGATDLGIDGQRIAVGGDSAGANLALAAALKLGIDGASPPAALLLNYGTFRNAIDSDSHRLYGGPDYSLSTDEMIGFWRDYLGDHAVAVADPLAEPLRASLDQLSGLPPTFLAIAACDVLRDDSLDLAARLGAAGVDVSATTYPGTVHSFLEAMSLAAVSRQAIAESAAWLRRHLAGSAASASPP